MSHAWLVYTWKGMAYILFRNLLDYVLDIFSTTTHQHIHHSVIVNWKIVIQNQCKGKKQKENTNFFVSGTAHSQRKLDPLVCNNEAMPPEEV